MEPAHHPQQTGRNQPHDGRPVSDRSGETVTLDSDLRSQLIEQAWQLAEERGWTWHEPVEVTSGVERGEAVWIVRTNVTMRSPSVMVMLRRSDHSLVHAGYLRR